MPLLLTRATVRLLDALTGVLRLTSPTPAHLKTGQRGEEAVYFHLRKRGYVMVARNWRSPRQRGEIDLIGWHGDTLCFIEVKTRTTHDIKPAEAAVDAQKQRELKVMARDYLRRLPANSPCRFDVASVYYDNGAEQPDITVFQNAFS
jgi:putative endonuclease